MLSNMGALLGWLVLVVCPHKLLYITLEDRVPKTKMNQQHLQQFCLSREMAELVYSYLQGELSVLRPALEGTSEPRNKNVITAGNFWKRQRRRSIKGR